MMEEENTNSNGSIDERTAGPSRLATNSSVLLPKMLSIPVQKPSLDPEEEIVDIVGQTSPSPRNDDSFPAADRPSPSARAEPTPNAGPAGEEATGSSERVAELWRAIRAINALTHKSLKDIAGIGGTKGNQENVRMHESSKKTPEKKKRRNDPYKDSALVRKTFDERMSCYENKKKSNVGAIATEAKTDEQAECTFTPEVNRYIGSVTNR